MKEHFTQILRQLEEAGLTPLLCDTPVPCMSATVQAGELTDPGDLGTEDPMWMPNAVVGNEALCIIPVRGESMIDAGFEPGDFVMVSYDQPVHDGDVVVALIDRQATLKTYMLDAKGNKWLVPYNPRFDAIRLTEDMHIMSVCRVVQHIKKNPRTSYREGQETIARTMSKYQEPAVPSRADIARALRQVAPLVNEKRKWYAVYRVLVDRELLPEADYRTFVQWVAHDVPLHAHLPSAQDLPRVALYSFAKPVALWREDKAPVSGKRYRDYCHIACRMDEELG